MGNDIVERLRNAADFVRHPMSDATPVPIQDFPRLLTEAADTIARLTAGVPVPVAAWELRDIHSALDDTLGDSDITHIESDEQLRDEEPVQWAAEKLAIVIGRLASLPPGEGVTSETAKEMVERLEQALVDFENGGQQKQLDEYRAARNAILTALAALKPFANCVFNDNGDMTVDSSQAKYDDFVRAYQIVR